MTSPPMLSFEFFKRHYLWFALAFSVLVSWHVSQEETQDVGVVEPATRQPSDAKTANMPKLVLVSDLGEQWPSRVVPQHPVVDIFNAAVPQAAQNASAASKAQNVEPPKPTIEESFNFSYFGKIEQSGNETVFLEDDNARVIAVRVGQPVSPQWQLVGSDALTITFRHNSSGNLYQMRTRPEQ